MKKLCLAASLLLAVYCLARSQTLSPTLLSSGSARNTATGFGSLEWSIGETMVETFSNANILTQGFHQVYLTVTATDDVTFDPSLSVFPNPTCSVLNIHSEQSVLARLFNHAGQLITSFTEPFREQQYDVSRLPAGAYFLEVRGLNTQQTKTFKIAISR
ncbi:MAG: T9SS type A sorting domain-containing protein [Saprospiraceae bacterium]|nr:T9SS type A sorting domain-containing protein [Saprospiraceae bacterium]